MWHWLYDATTNVEEIRHHDGLVPPLRASGPLLPPVLVDALADWAPHDDPEQVLWRTIQDTAVSWTLCRITLQVFIDNFDEELGTLLRLERAHVCAIIGRLRSFASWPFLEPDHVPTRHPDDEDLHPAEPDDEPDLPSIWRLDIVKILLQLPGVDRLRFPEGVVGHQCQTNRPFGSQSAYPGSESLHCTGGSNIVPASCLRYVRTGNSRCCSLTSCC